MRVFGLICFLCFFGLSAASQVIYDVFENESYIYEISQMELEISDKVRKRTQWIRSSKYKVDYFTMTNFVTKEKYNFKEQINKIVQSTLNSKKPQLALGIELEERWRMHHKIYKTRLDGESLMDYYEPCLYRYISVTPMFCTDEFVLFRVEFRFENSTCLNLLEEMEFLEIAHYFKIEFETGKVRKWNPRFTRHQKELLMNLIKPNLIAEYENFGYKRLEKYYAYFGSRSDSLIAEIVADSIYLDDAFIYPYVWGIRIEWQTFNRSTELYGGGYFSTFLPWDEVKDILKQTKGFEFVGELIVQPNGFIDFHFDKTLANHFYQAHGILFVSDLIRINGNKRIPDSLRVTRYQIVDGERKNEKVWNYQFNEIGNEVSTLNQKESYKKEKLYENNRLVNERESKDNKEISKTLYFYDNNNNLTREIRTGDDNIVYDRKVFYNGKHAYLIDNFRLISSVTKGGYPVRTSYYLDSMLCSGGVDYQYGGYKCNAKGQVVESALFHHKELKQKGEKIVRDSCGRIEKMITERIYDGKSYFSTMVWEYDRQGRLSKTGNGDMYFYQDDSRLPCKKEERRGGYVFVTEYLWY